MITNLQGGIDVCLNTDYLMNRDDLNAMANSVIFTGLIDACFNYKQVSLGTVRDGGVG